MFNPGRLVENPGFQGSRLGVSVGVGGLRAYFKGSVRVSMGGYHEGCYLC